jgi:hypothetical protein
MRESAFESPRWDDVQHPFAAGPHGTATTLCCAIVVVQHPAQTLTAQHRFFPAEKIHEVLQQTNRASIRERDLPAHVVIYYVIALALYMRSSYREVLRCLLEGVQWLLDPSAKVKVAGKSGISQARSRLGAEPLKKLYDAVVGPIAEKRTRELGTGSGGW